MHEQVVPRAVLMWSTWHVKWMTFNSHKLKHINKCDKLKHELILWPILDTKKIKLQI